MNIRERVFRNEFRRRRRLVLDEGVYHVMSRTVQRIPLFQVKEKEVFYSLLSKQAVFAGVEVITFCLMDNHFHLLLRISSNTDGIDDCELLRRYATLYCEEDVPQSTFSLEELREVLATGGEEASQARKIVMARMNNLSAFMRELKQRFSIWYNSYHEGVGTVWSGPFKSLLVEDTPESVSTVAAYIDLNPVRAEIVDNPADYRWSGYGAAMGGVSTAREGIRSIFVGNSVDSAIKSYRLILFGKGYGSKGNLKKDFGRISAKRLAEIQQNEGAVSLAEVLRSRVRYFTDGMVLGSEAFVEKQFERHRDLFGKKRTKGGTPLLGEGWHGLYSMRNLQNQIFS